MKQRGFTLVEMMVVLILIGLSSVAITRYLERDTMRQVEASVAQHGLQVAEAASAWTKDNYATVIANTTAGGSNFYTLTIETLKTSAYLPPSFNELSPIGQTYSIRFRQPTAGTIAGLMVATTSVGEAPDDISIRRMARQMGAPGGFVEAARPVGTPNSQIDGALGAWTVDASAWGWTSIPGGSLAYSLFFSQAESTGDFVYRRPVPGRPELNRMEAPLDMGGQPITNVGELTVTTVSGQIRPAAAGAAGTSCSPNGALGSGGATGLMMCSNGIWRAVALAP
jgi:prepilin-type N-terminal cleavage/methylation domain-containing protein